VIDERFADGARAIVEEIGRPAGLVFLQGGGNVGDHLIWEGTRALLREAGLRWSEASIFNAAHLLSPDDTVLVMGSGGWCRAHHEMPGLLAGVEESCARLIVLPSSFDPVVPEVDAWLRGTRATVFCRERYSMSLVLSLCRARLAHDCAFYYDWGAAREKLDSRTRRSALLHAYRTDVERAGFELPEDNEDISLTIPELAAWLARIAEHEEIHTDRAHVMIAAAMLGRRVQAREGNYYKIRGISEYSLGMRWWE